MNAALLECLKYSCNKFLLVARALTSKQSDCGVESDEGKLGLALAQKASGNIHSTISKNFADVQVYLGSLVVWEKVGSANQFAEVKVDRAAKAAEPELAGEGIEGKSEAFTQAGCTGFNI